LLLPPVELELELELEHELELELEEPSLVPIPDGGKVNRIPVMTPISAPILGSLF
jgi:hypothetical protein